MLDNIRKYVGGGDGEPKLNKLGSKEWENTKARVKNNLKEVARDLIELYARRQKAQGFMFSKDTPWQKQFEDSFPYQETDDQLRCIAEVKKIWSRINQWIDYFVEMLVMENRSCNPCSI